MENQTTLEKLGSCRAMKAEEKKNDPWLNESEDKGRGIFRSIYDFLSSLVMGLVGLIVFGVCLFTVFRHGDWLADVSILEWLLFFWLSYCFNAIKELAVEQTRSVFLFRWRLFAYTGWTMFWTLVGYAAWFKWGSDDGFDQTFFASNLFEMTLLVVVAFGFGLGVLLSLELENQKKEQEQAQGEVS